MSQYQIVLKNCAFFARHGVFTEEEALGQRFFVDARLEVEAARALEHDEIEGTVDYGKAFQVIEKVITGERRYLIEALAMAVAKAICRQFPMVRLAEITVRKPNAPVPGVLDHVEVKIVHVPE